MPENAFLWSVTASDNDDADAAVPWPEGMLPGSVNNSSRGIMAAVARLIKDINGTIDTGGSANAYTITSSSGHTALTNGIICSALAGATNTGTSTLNLNSLGAKKIRTFGKSGELELVAGQIQAGCSYQFKYDTQLDFPNGGFLLLNPTVDPYNLVTAGTIKIWTSNTLETGWLWANGSVVSQATYAALFAVIGTAFNTGGEGAGNFRLPDLRGRGPFGKDNMGGVTAAGQITLAGSGISGTSLAALGGQEVVTLTEDQIPAHDHNVTDPGHDHDITDPGHNHAVTDPGHNHGITQNAHDHSIAASNFGIKLVTSPTPTFQAAGGNGLGQGDALDVGTASADITINSDTTDITIDVDASNVTVDSTTTGLTVNNAGGGSFHTNMPPITIVNFVIKT